MSREYVSSPYAPTASSPSGGTPPRAPVVLQRLVLGSAAVTTALLVAAGVIATLQEDALVAWWGTASLQHGTVDVLNLLVTLTAATNLLAFVVTGLWLLDIRAIAEWASPETFHRRSSYWAFLGWIVPVINLWFPFQVVVDASRGVGSRVRTFWPWWIAWLALSWFSLSGGAGGELVTEADLTAWIRTHQVSAVVAVLACVLWWRVVRSATTASVARTEAVKVAA